VLHALKLRYHKFALTLANRDLNGHYTANKHLSTIYNVLQCHINLFPVIFHRKLLGVCVTSPAVHFNVNAECVKEIQIYTVFLI